MCADKISEGFVQVDAPSAEISYPENRHAFEQETNKVSETLQEASAPLPPSQPPSGIRTLTVDEVMERGDDDDDDYSDFEDETLAERLIGLTEMFPDWLRTGTSKAFTGTLTGLQATYSISRTLAWFAASTSAICLMPLMLELERQQMEEQEAADQRSMMLGTPGGAPGGLAGFQANVPILSPAAPK